MTGATMCSGIGAPETAAPEIDWKWCAEVEPFPSAVLATHRPFVTNLGDVTREDFIERALVFGPLDIFVAGTPCQGFSIAGLRGSLGDARSNIMFRFVETANAINPGIVVWENVPGVLSTEDNAFGCLLGALAGHDAPLVPGRGQRWTDAGMVDGPARRVAWRVLDAQYFGVAQRRERVFVVACPRNGTDPAEILFEREGVQRHSPPSREAGQSVTGSLSARTKGGGGLGTDFDCQGGLVAEAYGGGNCSGPIDIATAQTRHGCRQDFDTETFVTHALRADGFDASEDGTGRGTPLVPVCFGGDAAPTLTSNGDAHSGYRDDRGLIPVAVALNFRGREGGTQAELGGDVATSLRCAGGTSSKSHAMVGMAVRRLTPTECERLQGFPDGATAIVHRGKPAADGPRYKALGNSMAVPVLRWIINRAVSQSRRPSYA